LESGRRRYPQPRQGSPRKHEDSCMIFTTTILKNTAYDGLEPSKRGQ
jgi:hypothetical protein